MGGDSAADTPSRRIRPPGPSVVVLSGGQDSTTTLALAARESTVTVAVFFEYGQRHRHTERAAARRVADHFEVPLVTVPIESLRHVGESALTGVGSTGAPHPTLEHLPASFVPGRNLLFLTLAAALAQRGGATRLYTGVCETDFSGYPDCRAPTIESLERTLRLGLDFPELEIRTPLMRLSKAATFALAESLGALEVVLEESRTCYEGENVRRFEWGAGCGECPACRIRADGFAAFRAGDFAPLPATP